MEVAKAATVAAISLTRRLGSLDSTIDQDCASWFHIVQKLEAQLIWLCPPGTSEPIVRPSATKAESSETQTTGSWDGDLPARWSDCAVAHHPGSSPQAIEVDNLTMLTSL